MFTLTNMPSTTSVLSTYTTVAASAMLVRTVVNEVQNLTNQLLPQGLQEKIISKLGGLIGNLSPQMSITIDEYNGLSFNELYEASELYLRTKITPSTSRLKASKQPQEKKLALTVSKGEKISDTFEGIRLVWEFVCIESQKTNFDYDSGFSFENVEKKSIELTFDKKHMEKVLSSYLPFVMERYKAIKDESKVVKLQELGNYYGNAVNLDHPSTFDTLAMDPTVKRELMDDLDRFVKRKDYYRRVGKAWKRGYLLYGPPGTGKSSLIAAMANYLKFDIYDMELTSVNSNAGLKQMLVSTANRSIIVIEDIDCSVELQNREVGGYNHSDSQLTLSGLLNFMDGLWSSCGDERIIVFTTNHKDKLDPALLRPGRMDKHIHMSYITPCGFKILAQNYLLLNSHSMFGEIEKLITEVEVTPAEVAEELMKSEEADVVLEGLIKCLERKKNELCESSELTDQGVKEEGGKGKEIEEETKIGNEKKVKKKKSKKLAKRRKMRC